MPQMGITVHKDCKGTTKIRCIGRRCIYERPHILHVDVFDMTERFRRQSRPRWTGP